MKIKIKYCGLLNEVDVANAAACKADAVGFVFVKKSKRYIESDKATELIKQAKSSGMLTVALFADQSSQEVKQIIELTRPDVVQFHGSESVIFCESFNHTYWKAIPMLSGYEFQNYMMKYPSASMFLLDAYGEKHSGGSGQTFDWFRFPQLLKHKMILAGGLNKENIMEAIHATGCEYIDVSSGIEGTPGVKSKEKMMALAQMVKDQ